MPAGIYSKKAGLTLEWEFAARGGNDTNGYTYAGSFDLDAVGWYNENSRGAACDLEDGRGIWPVGMKDPNELGLYDMSGNVWEWCWDEWFDFRIVRGGSWKNSAMFSLVWGRAIGRSIDLNTSSGFRLARTPAP